MHTLISGSLCLILEFLSIFIELKGSNYLFPSYACARYSDELSNKQGYKLCISRIFLSFWDSFFPRRISLRQGEGGAGGEIFEVYNPKRWILRLFFAVFYVILFRTPFSFFPPYSWFFPPSGHSPPPLTIVFRIIYIPANKRTMVTLHSAGLAGKIVAL